MIREFLSAGCGTALFLIPAVAAARISVTSVRVEKLSSSAGPVLRRAEVGLNRVIRVRNVEFLQMGGISFLRMPVYRDKDGKPHAQIRVLDQGLYEEMLQAVFTGKRAPTETVAKDIPFKVGRVQILESSFRVANVEVVLDDSLTVVFGMLKDEKTGRFRISYPVEKLKNGRYSEQVIIKDGDLKNRIEKEVMAEFAKVYKRDGAG